MESLINSILPTLGAILGGGGILALLQWWNTKDSDKKSANADAATKIGEAYDKLLDSTNDQMQRLLELNTRQSEAMEAMRSDKDTWRAETSRKLDNQAQEYEVRMTNQDKKIDLLTQTVGELNDKIDTILPMTCSIACKRRKTITRQEIDEDVK